MGAGKSAYNLTGLDNTPPSEHQANDISPTVHAHANSSHGLPLQLTEGSANLRHGQPLVDTNAPEHLITSTPSPPPSSPDEVRCGQCNVPFTGDDMTNNLARHIRTQHPSANESPLMCKKCKVVCTRNDALLKHERKCQPGLHPDPVKRKKNKTDTATTPSRRANKSSTPRRRPAKRPTPTKLGSAPQIPQTHAPAAHPTQASYTLPDIQQAPREGSLAHDFFNIRGAGNGLSIPSQSYDPAAGEDQAFQELHNDLQQAVEAAPLHQSVWPFQFGQQNLAPYNAVRQEGWPSPQHLTFRLGKDHCPGIITRLFRGLMKALFTVKRITSHSWICSHGLHLLAKI
ncbi:uncharacterized protein J4E84_009233 [Alternaria hordeiaustralica]|uniref:uncharacterized protein n=1 Tax=Alternaria hordeiaustralica TaxID=1187925 RepID=UPI0020C358CB|nr:uncharacterized protein J4E84_009233 [Alternaria hordeiaustralica]KAI4676933.1 hypothetical protein J4E84_009233 [Alternaria hordeiaustralica]